MKTASPMVPLLVALASLEVTGCTSAPAAPSPPMPAVSVTRPVRMPLVEWDRYTGRVEAVESVEVRARVSGYLHSHHFEEGAVVEAGALLFVIDPRPFQADLHRAEAAVAETEARSARAEAQRRQAQALGKQAEAELDLAARRLRRGEEAVMTHSIASEEVDVRRAEAQKAEAALLAARAAEASAVAEIALARASLGTARAVRERAALELSYTELRAPISGRISRRQVTEGNLVQGGIQGTVLTTIVSLDPIDAYFDATEADLLRYARLERAAERAGSRKLGEPVYLALADDQGYPHRGELDFVENRLDPGTGTIRGRARFPNPDGVLIPGLFGTVRIPGSARYQAILVPDSAIGADLARRFVMVVGEGDVVQPRDVLPGPMANGLRVIREGLRGDERIVSRGLQRLRPGTRVRPSFEETVVREHADGLPDDYRLAVTGGPVADGAELTVDRKDS